MNFAYVCNDTRLYRKNEEKKAETFSLGMTQGQTNGEVMEKNETRIALFRRARKCIFLLEILFCMKTENNMAESVYVGRTATVRQDITKLARR